MAEPALEAIAFKQSANAANGGWEGTGPFTLNLTTAPPNGLGTIVAGDLLLLFIFSDGNPTLTSPTAGWTKVGQVNSTGTDATCSALFRREADGSETQFQVQSSANEGLGGIFVKVRGWSAYNISSVAGSGSDDTIDPPAVNNPGITAAQFLMFAQWDRERNLDSENVVTTSGYTRQVLTILNTAGGFFGGASAGLWSKVQSVASENLPDNSLNLNTSGGTQYKWTSWMVAIGGTGDTFSADAVLKKTATNTFTANAELVDRKEVAFTADAILVAKVFEDNFDNRTTLGSLGTTSGTGTYVSFTTGDDYEVNVSDGYLSTPALKVAQINYSPSIDRGLLVFDFWTGANVDDTDPTYAGIGYEIAAERRIDFQSLPLLTIGDVGSGAWEIKVGNNDPETTTLDRETWYRVKTWFDYEDTFHVKVWEPTDPEPDDWQYSYAVEDTQATDFQVSHIFMGANEHGGPRIDNLSLFRASGTTYPKFTADAFFERPTPSAAFFANAILVKGFVGTFTADASIAHKIEGSFTADAYFQVREHRWFSAQAWIHKPRPAVDVTNFTKRVSLGIADRRKRPDETYVPPRELDPEPDINIGPDDGPCLPPCPPTSAGPGSPWGANGQAIRRAAYRCTACSDSIVYTPLPMMGLNEGSESGHDCCNISHNKGYHVHRLWVKYLSMPTVMFNMKANLKWTTTSGGVPNTVSIRVYANIPDLPNVSDGECIPYDNATWNGGDHVGNLLFVKHAGTSTTAFDTTPASLTLDPRQLSTGTFRFQCENEGIVIRPEFRASNAEIY